MQRCTVPRGRYRDSVTRRFTGIDARSRGDPFQRRVTRISKDSRFISVGSNRPSSNRGELAYSVIERSYDSNCRVRWYNLPVNRYDDASRVSRNGRPRAIRRFQMRKRSSNVTRETVVFIFDVANVSMFQLRTGNVLYYACKPVVRFTAYPARRKRVRASIARS